MIALYLNKLNAVPYSIHRLFLHGITNVDRKGKAYKKKKS